MKQIKSLQRFIDRIGKKVYRNPNGCTCNSCQEVGQHGLIIDNRTHAEYLHMIECDYAGDGVFLDYSDEPKIPPG